MGGVATRATAAARVCRNARDRCSGAAAMLPRCSRTALPCSRDAAQCGQATPRHRHGARQRRGIAMGQDNAVASPRGKTTPWHRHGENRIFCALLPMTNVPLSLFCGVLPGLRCVFQTFAAFFPKSASERVHFGKNRAFCRWGIFLAEAVGFAPSLRERAPLPRKLGRAKR